MNIQVEILPILRQNRNYAYVLRATDGTTAIVDPGEAEPIIEYLNANNLSPSYILNTHHHWDHTDGNKALIDAYGAKLVGPAAEADRIENLDIALKENDHLPFGDEHFEIIETPGHTSGHICFYAPQSKLVFTGDTLFIMGCGRLFEGSAETMYNSLRKLAALPDDTKVYCGHEYTVDNAKFCASIEPQNQNIQTRFAEIKTLRAQNKPTVPSTIGLEKKTNSFLRASSAGAFAHIRQLKDKS